MTEELDDERAIQTIAVTLAESIQRVIKKLLDDDTKPEHIAHMTLFAAVWNLHTARHARECTRQQSLTCIGAVFDEIRKLLDEMQAEGDAKVAKDTGEVH